MFHRFLKQDLKNGEAKETPTSDNEKIVIRRFWKKMQQVKTVSLVSEKMETLLIESEHSFPGRTNEMNMKSEISSDSRVNTIRKR